MNPFRYTKHSNTTLSIRDLTLTALMTASICIVGPLAFPMPFSPIPLSLTNLVLFLMIYVLDVRCCMLCYTTYFFLGATGLPVFSGFSGGLGFIAGPTGGYLIGFFFQVAISAHIMKHCRNRRYLEIIGLILGMTACYGFGTLWLAWLLELSPKAGLGIGVLPYLPGDILKLFLASMLGPRIRKILATAVD